jgi:hypothetical protein
MINSWGSAAKKSERGSSGLTAGVAVALAIATGGCASPKPPEPVAVSTSRAERLEAPRTWAFDSLDARPVSADAMRGKPTVIAFITTDNLGSQAQVNYLVAMAKNDQDEVNYVLVAMHPRKDRELVELYRSTLGVSFPVALADDVSMSGAGPFPVEHVPTLVVLDREGRLVWRETGLAKPADIRAHLR